MILLTDLTEGIGIAIIGYIIVFLALVFLYFIFYYLPKLLNYFKRRKRLSENNKVQDEEIVVTGEVATSIAMALYLSRILHDEESDVLTIKKVSKTYTPWSSKIYSMRNYPR
jgi:Na+-transporting methylmalonyl-CoA/oxaloacetate decarboxylase gamma subunit